jgi:hypothetical protein
MVAMMIPAPIARRFPAILWYARLLGLLLAIKAALLLIDHAPMFFLGDSVSYMNTAIGPWIPPDRSFVYGRLIRLIALPYRSLTLLLAAQSAATALAALLVAFILRHHFKASPRLAACLAILCALEPLQLLYERYVMTESFALVAFAIFTTFALQYLRNPTLLWLVPLQLASVAVVSLRVSFLPLLDTSVLLVPLLALPALMRINRDSRPAWPRFAGHLVLSVLLFVTLQSGYKRSYADLIQGQLPGAPPAYYYDNGFHLLAFVAPIVEPDDFPHPDKASQIFGDLAFDLRDYRQRDMQRWHPHGLIANLKAAYPDHLLANNLALQTAFNALKRDPLGELVLAFHGYADYFHLDRLRTGLVVDRGGDRELPDDLLLVLRKHFDTDGTPLPHLDTLTNRYFFLAWPWYLALLLLPLPALFAVIAVPPPQRPAAFLLLVYVCLHIAIIAAFSISPTVRFLHPVAWLAMIVGGILAARLLPSRKIPEPAAASGVLSEEVALQGSRS